ncbi:hypothetical protein N7528_009456 [Penicillium herquei]|nr:hypothetical protein N7528_009456 [Penicillium herquei]
MHEHYDLEVDCVISPQEKPRSTRVKKAKKAIIPAHTAVPVAIAIPKKTAEFMGDMLFIPEYSAATERLLPTGGFYTQATDQDFESILVRNDGDDDFTLPRHTYVGFVEELDNVFLLVISIQFSDDWILFLTQKKKNCGNSEIQKKSICI